MRYSAVVAVVALPLLVLAQDKFKLDTKWEKGAKAKYSFVFNFVIDETKADVTGSVATEAMDEGKVLRTYDKVQVIANEQALDYTSEPSEITLDKSGYLKKIDGGIDGGDTARMYLATSFIGPTIELGKGEVWKQKFDKNGDLGLGEISYEATYQGPDKIGEKDAHKYTTKLLETGNDFSVDNTVWVTAAGKVLKIEGTFKNMPVPAATAIGSGKHKLEIVN